MTIIEHLSGPFRGRDGRFPAAILGIADMVVVSIWYGIAQIFVLLPPPVGAFWLLLWLTLFWQRYIGPEPGVGSRRYIEVKPFRESGGVIRTYVMVLAVVFLIGVIGDLYKSLPWVRGTADASWAAYGSTPAGAAVVMILLVAIAPLFEEVGYRAWLMDVLHARYGRTPAILLSSAGFAVGHPSLDWLPFFFIAGVLLAALVLMTGSIWVAVAAHAAHNLAQPLFDAGVDTLAVLVLAAAGGMGITAILQAVLPPLMRRRVIDAAPAG